MTAVEYIKEKLLGNEYWYEDMTFDQIIDQAKEMEKEQMIEFACQVAEASAEKYIQGKTTEQIAKELITIKSEL
jgi:hypothetical protein